MAIYIVGGLKLANSYRIFLSLILQYSLPSDASMNYMDNFMQLPEDSVPCKIRAKRGCATHPRSIAERVS